MAQRKKRLDHREQEKVLLKERQEKIKAEKEQMKMLELLGTKICEICKKVPATEYSVVCKGCAWITSGGVAQYSAGKVLIKQNLGEKLAAALNKKS